MRKITEAEVRRIVNDEFPNRVIESITLREEGYLVVAYDKNVGPLDMSGTVFMVDMNGGLRKLSVAEMLEME